MLKMLKKILILVCYMILAIVVNFNYTCTMLNSVVFFRNLKDINVMKCYSCNCKFSHLYSHQITKDSNFQIY